MIKLDQTALDAASCLLPRVWPGGFEDQSIKPLNYRPNDLARRVATDIITVYLDTISKTKPVI